GGSKIPPGFFARTTTSTSNSVSGEPTGTSRCSFPSGPLVECSTILVMADPPFPSLSAADRSTASQCRCWYRADTSRHRLSFFQRELGRALESPIVDAPRHRLHVGRPFLRRHRPAWRFDDDPNGLIGLV